MGVETQLLFVIVALVAALGFACRMARVGVAPSWVNNAAIGIEFRIALCLVFVVVFPPASEPRHP